MAPSALQSIVEGKDIYRWYGETPVVVIASLVEIIPYCCGKRGAIRY